ncbi:MAG TPA: hypothetical protein VGL04_12680 [Sporichthyaceae bacterium]|jgi:hypothetical protein
MNLVKTLAVAGGAMVTAIGVLAATAPEPRFAAEPFNPEPEDEPSYDEAGGYRHDDTLTRLTALVPA